MALRPDDTSAVSHRVLRFSPIHLAGDMTVPQVIESYELTHVAPHVNKGQQFFIFVVDCTPRVQIYIPYSGHKNFSTTGRLATLFHAVLTCVDLLTAAEEGKDMVKDWRQTFTQNGVNFIGESALDVGCCIKIFHSDSVDAYKEVGRQKMVARYTRS
jgi:hypothetical protein